MNRLTKRNEKYNSIVNDKYNPISTTREINNKLGQLEDLMEKYEIESIDKLEEIIKDYDEMAKDIVELELGVKVDFEE